MKTLELKSFALSLFVILASVIFITSCEQEEPLLNDNFTQEESLKVRFNTAKVLSELVQSDNSILPALERLCYKSEENGHTDVEFFYHLEKDVTLGGSNTLSKMIESSAELRSDETIELCNVPGLSFLLEGNLEAETFSNRIYVDDGFDDSDPNAHIKYYENGVLGSHPISVVPDAKAIVVRISEAYVTTNEWRYDANSSIPNAIQEVGKTDCGKSITVLNRKLAPVDAQSATDGESTDNIELRMCDRDLTHNKTENLKKFKTTNDYEGWRGKGEFFWLIIFADDIEYELTGGGVQVTGNPLDFINTGEFGSVKENIWYRPDFSSIIWDLEDDGNRMKYVAYEADGGSERILNLTLTATFDPGTTGGSTAGITGVVPVTINNGDDFIGETIVEYCHDLDIYTTFYDEGFRYNYGAVSMYINNR